MFILMVVISTILRTSFNAMRMQVCYPLDYALVWYNGLLDHYRATGDTLTALLPAAQKCMAFLLKPENFEKARPVKCITTSQLNSVSDHRSLYYRQKCLPCDQHVHTNL